MEPARYRTPLKHGALVLGPTLRGGDFDSHAVDCPFPFAHGGGYAMTYVGWDGIGYRTGLARSDDLVSWRREGVILDRGPAGSVTEFNVALTSILRDNELFGAGALRKVGGRFVGTYHSYPRPGYEAGPAVIGLCFSDDLRKWEVGPPVLRPDPSAEWEAGGLYKSWLLEHDGLHYLFYNAKNARESGWIEQTGAAVSGDLEHWERLPGNPLLRNGSPGAFDDLFASDPAVFRDGDCWVMFYFGSCSDGHARDGVAFSGDLVHWEKSGEVLVDIGGAGSVDAIHAHKPGLIARGGRLFHFYCAVGPAEGIEGVPVSERRGITFAASD